MKKISKKVRALLIISAIVLLTVFLYYENNELMLTEHTYNGYELTEEDKGFCIVQISDLHNKEFGKDNCDIVDMTEESKPDVIVITGDLIDSFHTDMNVAIKLARQLVEIAPVYYVTGNHERAINDSEYFDYEKRLEETGVNILTNRSVFLEENICLIGLDDMSIGENDSTLKNIMEEVPEEKLSILLAHEPQYIGMYSECGADIVLSGHAHGGQMRIPFTNVGIVAPGQGFFPKYTSGKYIERQTTMFVSRGLGNSIIPFRVFNRPEVVKITIG